MRTILSSEPSLGSTKVTKEFAWFPIIITEGNTKIKIWLETYNQYWEYCEFLDQGYYGNTYNRRWVETGTSLV